MQKNVVSRKGLSFFAMILSLVMFTAFILNGACFTKRRFIVSVAHEGDEFLTEEDDIEDLRYIDLLPRVFPEENVYFDMNEEECWLRFVGYSDAMVSDEVEYDCEFDSAAMQFTFNVKDSFGQQRTIRNEALIDYNGGLDAAIPVEETGEIYYISQYRNDAAFSDLLQNIVDGNEIGYMTDESTSSMSLRFIGWFVRIVAIVIVVYIIVAETAEQIKANKNYTYNQNRESNNLGVGSGEYIDAQEAVGPAGYRFGFTTFDKVGCEVASVYNLMIALDRSEMLSETIYNFEKWAIEYSVGWGHLGSNPRDIYRYLKRKGIGYRKYSSMDSFYNAVEFTDKVHYIMSGWNESVSDGLHTYYVNRDDEGYYYSYNNEDASVSDIREFIGYREKRFIIGYIIYP